MAIGQTDAISSNLLDYIHSLSDSAEQICLEKLGNLLNTLTVGEAYGLMYAGKERNNDTKGHRHDAPRSSMIRRA